ncbi:Uncharacterised protein [Acinetobacter baumannii]|nr:Uncharacterised protein [Acinetobacter baumannii]
MFSALNSKKKRCNIKQTRSNRKYTKMNKASLSNYSSSFVVKSQR